jgi:hypothetical protein
LLWHCFQEIAMVWGIIKLQWKRMKRNVVDRFGMEAFFEWN